MTVGQQGLWWRVTFSPDDLRWHREIGLRRMAAKGEAVVEDRKRVDRKRSAELINIFGVSCEHAVEGCVPGTEFDWSISPTGDDGITDFRMGHRTGQVKGTFVGRDDVCLSFKPGAFRADIAVLVAADEIDPSVRYLPGWIEREEFLQKYQEKSWGYGTQWICHWRMLRSITDLRAVAEELR